MSFFTCRRWVAFLSLSIGLHVYVSAQGITADTLVNTWQLHVGETQSSGLLDLRDDGSFVQEMDSGSRSGSWMLNGGKLTLLLDLVDQNRPVDSVHYKASSNQAVLSFFHEGEEVARQTSSGLESERYTETFQASFDELGNVHLEGEDQHYLLTGRGKALVTAFTFEDMWRGILGMIFLVLVLWLLSSNRRSIDWRLVGMGLGLQVIFAILVLKVPVVNLVFAYIAQGFVSILNWTAKGSEFLFGELLNVNVSGYIFAFQVLPVVVFFSALTSLFYYLGILQRVVYGFAWIMKRTMRLSGAESLAAAGNIFLGQTEAPLLIKPYLDKMTRSEVMALMTGGMATIAGAVFGAYVGYLGGSSVEEQELFATHLLTASIMSAPAALVAAKMLIPEKEEFLSDLSVPRDKIGSNVLDAITNGSSEGLRLAVNVGVMLLVFIALIKGINVILSDLLGDWIGLNEWVATSTSGKYDGFTLEYIFGLLLSPVAWMLGVPAEDTMLVGQLLGEKTVANEFVAYTSLGSMKASGSMMYSKSIIIATYALCGFANFASIGIQIGGIGALAPKRRVLLSELGIKALIGGTVAAFFTAVLAGMLTQF